MSEIIKITIISFFLSFIMFGSVHAEDLYGVEIEGGNIVVVFNRMSTVRHHTSKGNSPYKEFIQSASPDRLIILPRQWLEIKINGQWVFASNADNR